MLKKVQNIGVLCPGMIPNRHFPRSYSIGTLRRSSISLSVRPNKRVSLVLALRSTRFLLLLRHLSTISLQFFKFLTKTDTRNDENSAMRMLHQNIGVAFLETFSCGRAKTIQERLRVDTNSCENGEKKNRFQIRVDGAFK